MKKLYAFSILVCMLCYSTPYAQTLSLIKDINAGSNSSNPYLFTNVNGTAYFRADDGIHANELWRTNGNDASTSMVKDIATGNTTSDPFYLANMNGTLFFTAMGELWKSDGTEAGTVMVKDIDPAGFSSPLYLTGMNGTLYFRASDGINGYELWKSDGTESGTVMVKDIAVGNASSMPASLVNINGVLYFSATNGINGYELWKSDGTEAGTVVVKDIYSGINGSKPDRLTNVNGTLYFWANDGTHGGELWKSNGSAAGTVLVKDIASGSTGSGNFLEIAAIQNLLYFSADNGLNGIELWKSDGTEAGTAIVKDISPGLDDGEPNSFKELNGVLYFRANDGTHGVELWKSDGTPAGTSMVKDISTDRFTSISPLAKVGNKLLFTTDPNGISGRQLWHSDGTAAGTIKAQDIDANFITQVGGNVYAAVTSGGSGTELWAGAVPNASTLPLRFLEFSGRFRNDDAALDWKTTEEVNAADFIIERSTDGQLYTAIGSLPATNTPGVNHYYYLDRGVRSLEMSAVYYRLKQVDRDHNFTYSDVVKLLIEEELDWIELFPNPVIAQSSLRITLDQAQRIWVRIFDNAGKLVKGEQLNMPRGTTVVPLELTRLSHGIYFLDVRSASTINKQVKFIR